MAVSLKDFTLYLAATPKEAVPRRKSDTYEEQLLLQIVCNQLSSFSSLASCKYLKMNHY